MKGKPRQFQTYPTEMANRSSLNKRKMINIINTILGYKGNRKEKEKIVFSSLLEFSKLMFYS